MTWLKIGLIGGLVLSGGLSQSAFAESAADLRMRGLAYRSQGQLSEAIAAFNQAVELEPADLGGRVTLGWTLHLAQRDRDAADVLEATLLQDPYYTPAFNALGIVYLVNDDLLSAVLTHSWATVLDAENEVAHYNLSLAYERLKDYPQAIAHAQTAAKLEPQNPHPLVALAIAYAGQGDVDLAKQTYEAAIALDARYRNASFLNGLDRSGFHVSQIAQAKTLLQGVKN